MTKIVVRYSSIDRYRERRTFKTLKGAQRYAQHWIGAHPSLGGWYAVSDDGVGKIEVDGCALRELFPPAVSHQYATFSCPTELPASGRIVPAWYAQRDDGEVVGGPFLTEAEAVEAVRRDREGY
jgi:hypothetical protein